MITGKAYIKIEKLNNKNIINRLLEESFKDLSFEWIDNIGIIEVENCDSFKQKLINLFSFQTQDLGIKYSILIVPSFDKIFVKYLDYFYNEVYTVYELFIKRIDDKNITNDIKYIYNNWFDKNDIDTLIAYINCNMNSSMAANELYLHRNSMNYRMNHFIMKTSIDIRDINSIMFLNLILIENK